MTRECIDFASAHLHDDTARLLLSAARYPAIDMPAAVQQIEGLRTAQTKWPRLAACPEYEYPPRLNREQASSEATASFKATLVGRCGRVADLTGGMGVDTVALAQVAEQVDYVELDPRLCALMERNCRALGVDNVHVHCADCIEWLASQHTRFDLLYADPARRDAQGRKVAAFEACAPDLLRHSDLLHQHSTRLLIKASPMIDLNLAVQQLGNVSEAHVASLHGECKEVLFLCSKQVADEPHITATLLPEGYVFSFTRSEETTAEMQLCSTVGAYLYEPDAALMKAGPFRLIGQRWGLQKLAPNTHLYTSDRLVTQFAGRVFRVLQEVSPSRKAVRAVLPDGKASVICRNYPLSATELQRSLHLTEGGDALLLATTVGQRRTAFLCQLYTKSPRLE